MLRDNFIEDVSQQWLTRFRSLPEIKFVMKLIDLDNPTSVNEVKSEWIKLESNLQMITVRRMIDLGYPLEMFSYQYDHFDNM